MVAGAITMYVSFQRNIRTWQISLCVSFLAFANFGVSLVTATYANMPPYYLTNLLFLIFVLVITASGLNFRHSLLLNSVCLGVFLFYSQVVREDPFYFSQYPHLFSIFIYIHIVGIVLESRRRMNFLDFNQLDVQKKLVEALNQQKNKIISILSHDIASPLNSLSGLLNLQTRGIMKPEDVNPHITLVNERLGNVHVLLQSLMRWSKSQIDGFVPDKKPMNVAEAITQTCQQFASQLQEKSLTLNITGDKSAHAEVDLDMIMLVFRNLISNAIKFSTLGTAIEISITRIAENFVIKFSNEGEPISDVQKEKLFTYEIDSTVGTSGEKGTGLGLAMSSYFVKLNNGQIYLEEAQKGRTVFCVAFPIALENNKQY